MRPTVRIHIGGGLGYAAIVVATLALSGVACPKPQPPPVTPSVDADAGPYVAPIRNPSESTCQAACQAAHTACPDQVDTETCQSICPNEDVSYATKLMSARNCDEVKAIDPGDSVGSTSRRGR